MLFKNVVLKNIAECSCLTAALLGCEMGEGLFCLISEISVRISQNNELIHFLHFSFIYFLSSCFAVSSFNLCGKFQFNEHLIHHNINCLN